LNHIIPEDKLKTTTLGDLTQSQIYDTSSATFIPQRAALEDLILIHKAKMALSIFGGNGIIPDSGAISSTAFSDAPPTGTAIQPAAGEVWRVDLAAAWVVNASGSSNDVTLLWTDGTPGGTGDYITATIAGSATAGKFYNTALVPTSVHTLTNSLYLAVVGTASGTLNIPYTLVAM